MPFLLIDLGVLIALLAAAVALGLALGWLVSRRLAAGRPVVRDKAEDRALLQLMSRADHGLDNYITSIQGHLAVLGEKMPSDPERWRIAREAIGQATAQMKRHVERLRLIRMGLDESSMRVAPVNITRLVEGILIELEPAATEREVSLRMEVQGPANPIAGDPQMFEEVFTTLLDNAVKHNPAGTEVVAEVTQRDSTVVVLISDNGSGISPDLVARIFEQGAGDRRAGASRGTGMGLYIAKMLTELHGGTITVESRPQRGSAFRVALPTRE